jgi:preprotein translocase subunit SecG
MNILTIVFLLISLVLSACTTAPSHSSDIPQMEKRAFRLDSTRGRLAR